ncbi:GNAT family N-acetyltransferase [Aquimarina aggregata]|uniref:GNAT family N-acetyltransferase n=1 Tax=Aquimarina aggregata TaxID=1642818 RepID=UPI002493644B|nr:GNAT family protein [Aquimarina aggregata]
MVELRDYQIGIAEQYAEYRNNPVIFDSGYDKVPNPFKLKDAKEFITIQLKKKPAHRKLIYWRNQFVGEIGIDIKEDVFKLSAEIGYFIAEPFWGNGIATKAIKLMSDYTFNNFNIIRIEAGVFDFNKSSMRVLEKNNFHLESIKKNAVLKNGKIIDDYLWIKLRERSDLNF